MIYKAIFPNFIRYQRLFNNNVVLNCERLLATQQLQPKQNISNVHTDRSKSEKISIAMRNYIEKTKSYDNMIKSEIAQFEFGKRHLARIMSIDECDLTQDKIDEAIEYLLPSGLHEKKARPMMRHPNDIIPKRRDMQFDLTGRPFHSFFYTIYPNYYQLMHDIVQKQNELNRYQDQHAAVATDAMEEEKYTQVGSSYINKSNLEKKLGEEIEDSMYEQFLRVMDRLLASDYSQTQHSFIDQYREKLVENSIHDDKLEICKDEGERAYVVSQGFRKTAVANVKVWREGHGMLSVNGKPMIDHFEILSDREQLLYPLQFLDLIGKVDIEATVESGGSSCQAGAIRLGISKALQPFLDDTTVEKMRIAGLLTRDPRIVERKKPGQSGARRKFPWRKR